MTPGQAQSVPDKNFGKQKTILLALAVAVLGTVFLLPRFVSDPWIADGSLNDPVIADSSPSSVSPSTAAEKTKYRQDSQSVLSQIIVVRDLLQEQSVEGWAPIEFQQGLDSIEIGDQQYSYGEYRQSLGSYEQALEEFTALEVIGQHKLSAALASGFEAIESLNITGAIEAGMLASMIAEQDQQVQELAVRIKSLPGLAVQLESGDQARIAGNNAAAQKAYQEAVNLDPLHQKAAQSLAAIKTEITESSFRQHMSRAYSALDTGDFEAAISAFEQAGTVHPGHPAIAQGMAQVENRRSQETVSRQIADAAQLESSEEWAQAVTVYEALLEQDPTLTEAKVKLIPARVRADLDLRLNDYSAEPLRLSQAPVYRLAQVTLNDARGIPNPGGKLRAQIDQLENLLERALTAVDVVFQSDNLTVVTLFRVAQLGQFEQTSLTLMPGKYVVGGQRQGFRDVRVEFSVTGEPLDGPIVVSCKEPI